MAVMLHCIQWTGFAWVLMLYNPVLCGNTFRSSYVKIFESCSLEGATNQTMLDSADCKYACLAKQDSGSCAAYQWEAETGTCRLQETLNVTTSSSGDSVGVLMDTDEPVVCSDDNDCPVDYNCHVDCGTLSTTCIAADCAAIHVVEPASPSGVYNILAGKLHIHKVWCDMDTDGGGWTVVLKRLDGSVDFYQDLAAYKQGFGDVSGEYWLSLDVLHALTSAKIYQLRADISDWEGLSAFSMYASMVVAGESDNYRLALGAFTAGEGGDAFTTNNGMGFSAKDIDRDLRPDRNCAQDHHGGFWYKVCLYANPTGKYYNGGVYSNTVNDGMQWRTWTAYDDHWYSMRTVELKLRP